MPSKFNTENKLAWCKLGMDYENTFVEKVAPYIGLKAEINPEKETNKYTYDLIVEGKPADLKHQSTSFWLSNKRYGLDPTTAVTMNLKDFIRYRTLYSELDLQIYFWVERIATQAIFGSNTYQCQALHGVWRIPFKKLSDMVDLGKFPLHEYEHRKDDTRGNAKSSYIFSVLECECVSAYTKLPDRGFLSSTKKAA
jgi:hypothetical protein